MTKTPPRPREGSYYGMSFPNSLFPDGTWLEAESFAYPDGGFTRRALAKFPDGKMRVVRCSIPDTLFSIPARGRVKGEYVSGFLTTDEEGVKFNQYEPKEKTNET